MGLRERITAVGVSDMTLLSTISNDAVNDNLKKRFENAEIYVRWSSPCTGLRIDRLPRLAYRRPTLDMS